MRPRKQARMRARIALPVLGLLLVAPALAQTERDADRIRTRLHDWAAAFNAGDADRACELFAHDVVAVVRGAEDAGKDAVCARLRRALALTDRRMRYTAEISDVLVSGDLAAVLLTWTLAVERDGRRATSEERGLDVFRRDPDGAWRIARFMAFTPGGDE